MMTLRKTSKAWFYSFCKLGGSPRIPDSVRHMVKNENNKSRLVFELKKRNVMLTHVGLDCLLLTRQTAKKSLDALLAGHRLVVVQLRAVHAT